MTVTDERSAFYWQRYATGGAYFARQATAHLAALRRGVGREPGSVPAMWPFYTQTNNTGAATSAYAAEHAALTLFAIHQQSQSRPMHRVGVGFGSAVMRLRLQGGDGRIDWSKLSPVDRRFNGAATATDLTELVMHLRGLVTQLRDIAQPLDYTMLFADLRSWDRPEGAARTRRIWGMQYFTRVARPDASTTTDEEST